MAKKLKPEETRGVSPGDLKRVINDINRHRENASENSGLAGQAVKQGVEQYSLDRPALMTIVRLSRAEAAKQQSTLRAIVEYAEKMGMFDQIDMFSDLIPTLKGIVQRAENQTAPENLGKTAAPKEMAEMLN